MGNIRRKTRFWADVMPTVCFTSGAGVSAGGVWSAWWGWAIRIVQEGMIHSIELFTMRAAIAVSDMVRAKSTEAAAVFLEGFWTIGHWHFNECLSSGKLDESQNKRSILATRRAPGKFELVAMDTTGALHASVVSAERFGSCYLVFGNFFLLPMSPNADAATLASSSTNAEKSANVAIESAFHWNLAWFVRPLTSELSMWSTGKLFEIWNWVYVGRVVQQTVCEFCSLQISGKLHERRCVAGVHGRVPWGCRWWCLEICH